MVRSGECGTEPPGAITRRDSTLTQNLVNFQGGIGSMKIDSLLVCLFVCWWFLVVCLFRWLVG